MSETKKANSFSKRTLLLIDSQQEFTNIVNDPEQSSSSENLQQQSSLFLSMHSACAAENIVVPRYGKVDQKMRNKSKKCSEPISSHGYFRQLQVQPPPDIYQPTSSDYHFIKSLKSDYTFDSKYTFSMKTFCDIIKSCQHNLHQLKTITVQNQAQQILENLSFNLPLQLITCFQIHQKKLLRQMILKVVEYWKSLKKKRQGFPLLRCYWPKNDITMAKYGFWMPFKTRVIEETNTKKPVNPYLLKLGHTEKQTKIFKECKQASTFYNEVKKISQQHSREYNKFRSETIKFHNYAELYGLKTPKPLLKVTECSNRLDYKVKLKRIGRFSYFQNPVVKLRYKSSGKRSLQQLKLFEVFYDPVDSQLNLTETQAKSRKDDSILYTTNKSRDISLSRSEENYAKSKKKVKLN